MSIRLRIAIMAALVLAVGIGVTLLIVTLHLRTQVRQMVRARVRSDANHLARLLVTHLAPTDKAEVRRVVAESAGDSTLAIRVLDSRGRIAAMSGPDRKGEAAALAAESLRRGRGAVGRVSMITTAAVPIRGTDGTTVGAVAVTLRTDVASRALRVVGMTAIQSGAAAAMICLVLVYALLVVLTRPLTDIRNAILGIASGNYSSRMPADVPSEMRAIAQAFNQMAEAVTERELNLQVLNQLGSDVTKARRLSDIAKHLNAASDTLLRARARLWAFNPRTDALETVPAAGLGGRLVAAPSCPISIAARESRAAYIGEDGDLPSGTPVCHALDPVHSGAAIPLRTSEGAVGAISIEASKTRQLTREGFALATAMANIVAPAVAAQIRTESQARSARLLQKVLAPPPPQKVSAVEIAAWYHPAEETTRMGGDYYDFINLPDDTLCLAIGDVSGKGLSAAEYTMMVKYLVRSYILEYKDPARALALTNVALLAQMRPEEFISLFLGMLDLGTGSMCYANAGHPPPLVISRSRELRQLDSLGVAAGLFPDVEYEQREHQFQSGDTMIMYTDGLSEARMDRMLYEETRMMDTLTRSVELPPGEMIDAIASDVREFTGNRLHDDIAIVIVRFR